MIQSRVLRVKNSHYHLLFTITIILHFFFELPLFGNIFSKNYSKVISILIHWLLLQSISEQCSNIVSSHVRHISAVNIYNLVTNVLFLCVLWLAITPVLTQFARRSSYRIKNGLSLIVRYKDCLNKIISNNHSTKILDFFRIYVRKLFYFKRLKDRINILLRSYLIRKLTNT